MNRFLLVATLATLALTVVFTSPTLADETFVRLTTGQGDILLQMKTDVAPRHVENFLRLGTSGFYDGTYFHRVIPGFMIQGGDPNTRNKDKADDGQGGPSWEDVLPAEDFARLEAVRLMLDQRGYGGLPPSAGIKAEFNSESHTRGTVSMARSQSPDSGGSQFFITVAHTAHLDGKYTIFGKVVTGMDVADAIVSSERDRQDNPLQPVHVTGFNVIDGVAGLTADEAEAWRLFSKPAIIEDAAD